MRVGIDYLPAVTHGPGMGRYARELVRALVRLPVPPALCLAALGPGARSVPREALGLDGREGAIARRLALRIPRRLAALLAAGPGIDGLLGGVEVFHHVGPGPRLTVRRARQTLALAELPSPGTTADVALAHELADLDGVLVFSQACRRALLERELVPPERVVVVPVGCDHWVRELAELPAPADPPEVLVLGATRTRRRHAAIAAACARLLRGGQPLRLVVVGAPGDGEAAFAAAVQAAGIAAHVARPLPDERSLPRIVAGATLLVHLDDDAGSAVTPLEAFSFGAAVVASRLPALVEAAGEHARWLDNAAVDADPEVLAAALIAGLADGRDAAARERRRRIASTSTWAACAAATLAAWERWGTVPRQTTTDSGTGRRVR